jgi:hypothetical protein
MLRYEHLQEDHEETAAQRMRPNLLETNSSNDPWNEVTKRSSKKHTTGKIGISELSTNQPSTSNKFEVLRLECTTSSEGIKSETTRVQKAKTRSISEFRNKNDHNLKAAITNEELKELDIREKRQHNLQIPTLINGQISMKVTSKEAYDSSGKQKRKTRSPQNKIKAFSNHKILIIGDSHAKGISEKVSNSLNNTYSVTGISKPNASIEVTTSPLHLNTENLTNRDLIIFYGGSKEVGSNETGKGIRALIKFAQRTSNTNVFILGVPPRYDLPHFSCVNREVKVYNDKLSKYLSAFKHVNILKIPTERIHHTTHGLHLNKRGKNLIANILVEEIKSLYLVNNAASPIPLPGNDTNNQNHLTCENSTIFVESKENISCPNTGNIYNNQETQGKDKRNLAEDAITKPLMNITQDDNVNIIKENSLLKTGERGEKESVVVTHETNCMGKIIDSTESSKEEVLTRKSTRTKKYTTVMNQDFLW